MHCEGLLTLTKFVFLQEVVIMSVKTANYSIFTCTFVIRLFNFVPKLSKLVQLF